MARSPYFKKLAAAFIRRLGQGFIGYLPESVSIDQSKIEVDGSWVAEKIMTAMPIRLG